MHIKIKHLIKLTILTKQFFMKKNICLKLFQITCKDTLVIKVSRCYLEIIKFQRKDVAYENTNEEKIQPKN